YQSCADAINCSSARPSRARTATRDRMQPAHAEHALAWTTAPFVRTHRCEYPPSRKMKSTVKIAARKIANGGICDEVGLFQAANLFAANPVARIPHASAIASSPGKRHRSTGSPRGTVRVGLNK